MSQLRKDSHWRYSWCICKLRSTQLHRCKFQRYIKRLRFPAVGALRCPNSEASHARNDAHRFFSFSLSPSLSLSLSFSLSIIPSFSLLLPRRDKKRKFSSKLRPALCHALRIAIRQVRASIFLSGSRNVISVCLSRFVLLWKEKWIPKPARRPRHVCCGVHRAVTANWPRVVTYRRGELQIIFRALPQEKHKICLFLPWRKIFYIYIYIYICSWHFAIL